MFCSPYRLLVKSPPELYEKIIAFERENRLRLEKNDLKQLKFRSSGLADIHRFRAQDSLPFPDILVEIAEQLQVESKEKKPSLDFFAIDEQ